MMLFCIFLLLGISMAINSFTIHFIFNKFSGFSLLMGLQLVWGCSLLKDS